MPGHVFVVPGDVTHVACDAWLLPTDSRLNVTGGWTRNVPDLARAVHALGSEADDLRSGRSRALALPDWPDDRPRPVLTTVPLDGVRSGSDVDEPSEAGSLRGPCRPRPCRRVRPEGAAGGDAVVRLRRRWRRPSARRARPDRGEPRA